MHIPVSIKLLIIFSAIVLSHNRKLHLGIASATGGVLFAFWTRVPVSTVFFTVISELTKPDTLLLLVMVSCVMMFASVIKQAGVLSSFARAVMLLIPSRRLAVALAPLFIGLLPMPGGALMSAPLVESFDDDGSFGPKVLATANYWFRHVLELVLPLYPAFMLTAAISGLSSGRLILLNSYAPVLLFLCGYFFIMPHFSIKHSSLLNNHTGEARVVLRQGLSPFFWLFGVYLATMAVWHVLVVLLPWKPAPELMKLIERYAFIFTGLAVSMLVIKKDYGKSVFRGIFNKKVLSLVTVVAGIKIFAALLDASSAGAALAHEFTVLGVSPFLVAALLPFISGLVTGVGFGYVGLSLPLVLSLAAADQMLSLHAAVVFAGVFGYAGMMLSPMHVCMVVTCGHFSVKVSSVIKRLLLPLFVFMVIGGGGVFLLVRLGFL